MLKLGSYLMQKQRFPLCGENILVNDVYYFPTKNLIEKSLCMKYNKSVGIYLERSLGCLCRKIKMLNGKKPGEMNI